MRLKSTPCEGAAVDQGIKRSPEPLVTWLLWLRETGEKGRRAAIATLLQGYRAFGSSVQRQVTLPSRCKMAKIQHDTTN